MLQYASYVLVVHSHCVTCARGRTLALSRTPYVIQRSAPSREAFTCPARPRRRRAPLPPPPPCLSDVTTSYDTRRPRAVLSPRVRTAAVSGKRFFQGCSDDVRVARFRNSALCGSIIVYTYSVRPRVM